MVGGVSPCEISGEGMLSGAVWEGGGMLSSGMVSGEEGYLMKRSMRIARLPTISAKAPNFKNLLLFEEVIYA